ncbi:phenylalanine--tRNA ligase subunit beta [Candidatus Saccharibacteria bacterium]|nr:phenylalanine--tRNA ligase subunit beta [Candidatus Saccharibacteria bacterium]
MKISLNWVRQFTDIDVTTDELVKLATERLGGIEGVTDLAKQYDGIVVAKVVSCEKHPNADKLSLCKVDDGGAVKDVERDENGYVQVVCGAPNVREGLLVAWIPPGAIVPASYGEKELFVLEARDLRGQLSNGMLASSRELGINDDHEGILEIEEDVQPGTPFKNLYDLDDTILEIENKMFTHRPDGFGHLGVAREIAGIQHKAFTSPSWYQKMENGKWKMENGGNNNLSVDNQIPDLCPRYMAVVLDNLKIAPSPIWLQSYLKRVGIRPINNVVDITNYMMALTAQPLHAFDFDKVAKNGKAEIVIRKPRDGEKMILLDGKEITPHKDAVLICNPDSPIALGGVMGGGNSEVDENTTRVVLECATFDMYNIRKTSMIHGIFTDAVTRFTKGQPKARLAPVITEAISMFEELVGAKQAGSVIDIADETNDIRHKTGGFIEIEAKFINDRLGSKFTSEEIVTLLNNVEIKAHIASGPIEVRTPFWRTDLEIKEDIVEEIGRLYGFNQLPKVLPLRNIQPVAPEPLRALKSEIRHSLARAGANEVLSYSFVHGNLLKKAEQDPKRAFAIRNALSPDLEYYRLSILPSLLDKVYTNVRSGIDEFVLFEIGKSHVRYPDDELDRLPDEYHQLEMVYTSTKSKKGAPYYQMLKYVDTLLSDLGIEYRIEKPEDTSFKTQSEMPFDMSRSARIFYKNSEDGGLIGVVGELEQSVINAFKLPEYSAAALFALDGPSFYPENRINNVYIPLSKYESSKQDITLKVASDITFANLRSLLESELTESGYNWDLMSLGVFQKEGESTKNISFRITLGSNERTLVTDEVTKLIDSLSWRAHEELGAEKI